MSKNIISIGTVFFSIFLMLCGLLAAIFFKNYKGDMIPNPNLWFMGGLVLFGLGIGILFMRFKQNANGEERRMNAFIAHLKKVGTPIKVNLLQCEVESQHSEKEVEETNSQVKAWDGIYSGNRPTRWKHEYNTCIVFNHGDVRYYSQNIPKDEATVRMNMELQKETVLYVDEKTGEYYFDVSFLDA